MYSKNTDIQQKPIRVGIAGTGYVAKLRTEFLLQDERSTVVAVAGSTQQRTQASAKEYQIEAMSSWRDMVEREDIDLVVICTVNRDHGAIASSALSNGKHVVVEYPLSLDPAEAEGLIALAKAQTKLLHVEHVELLGGVHQALKQHLSEIGLIFYARYSTINPQHPAPRKWTYNHELFGFPLVGALSRLHRVIDLFGKVTTVNCHNRFWQIEPEYYQACLCVAQLNLKSGLLAQVIYGKGETLWQPERKFEVHGERGALIFDGEHGFIIRNGDKVPVEVGTRRGLFSKDTSLVLDHLINGTPLYVSPEESLYTLKIADAARRSANTGETKIISDTLDQVK